MTKKIKRETLENGDIIMYFADENWGPVVTGSTLKEANEKFIEALKVCLITKALLRIKYQVSAEEV